MISSFVLGNGEMENKYIYSAEKDFSVYKKRWQPLVGRWHIKWKIEMEIFSFIMLK